MYFRYVKARAEKFDDQHSKTAAATSQIRPVQPSFVTYWPAEDVDSPSSNVPDERTAYVWCSLTPFEIASSNSAHSFVDRHWLFNLNETIYNNTVQYSIVRETFLKYSSPYTDTCVEKYFKNIRLNSL